MLKLVVQAQQIDDGLLSSTPSKRELGGISGFGGEGGQQRGKVRSSTLFCSVVHPIMGGRANAKAMPQVGNIQ